MRERDRVSESERGRERERVSERESERVCVCVCIYECVKEYFEEEQFSPSCSPVWLLNTKVVS